MHASTQAYLELQRVYRAKADADAAAVAAHARALLEAAGADSSSISPAEVKHFCKHARYLRCGFVGLLLVGAAVLLCGHAAGLVATHRDLSYACCRAPCSLRFSPLLLPQAGALAVAGGGNGGGQLPGRGAAQRAGS